MTTKPSSPAAQDKQSGAAPEIGPVEGSTVERKTIEPTRGDSTVIDPDTGKTISINGKPVGNATSQE